jgi:hypothetical protein
MYKIGERIVFRYDGVRHIGIPCFMVHKIGGFVCVFCDGSMFDTRKIELVSNFGPTDYFYVEKQFLEMAKAFRVDSLQALPDNQNQLLVIKNEPDSNTLYEAKFVLAFFDARMHQFFDRDCEVVDIEKQIVVPTGQEGSIILSDRGMKALEKIYPNDI